jgi:3-hydroxyisobutyrate dehydrogenase
MTNVGWIGLGAMGSPMASFVATAGHTVTAFDIDPQKAAALADDGVRAATTVSDAAADADVLVLMVATAEQAESVLFGDGKAAAALKPGSVVLLMATVGPTAVEEWARRLAVTEVQVVDAPVSGGAARAGQGDLLIMVSGSESALAAVQPLLEVMARNAPVVGTEPGEGQKVKLVNQLLCGVRIAVAAEALAYAEALGLDAGATWEVLRHGAAASFMLDDRGARMIDNPSDDVRSAIDIFVKDMGLVTAAARATSYPAPLASTAEQLYLAGRRAGLGRADDSSLIQILRGTATAST